METEDATNRRGRGRKEGPSFCFCYPGNAPTGKEYSINLMDLKPKKKFSNIAVDNLSKRLLEEEKITKKLVYLNVCGISLYSVDMGWLTVNGNGGPNENEVCVSHDTIVNLESEFPQKLWNLTCYGCAVLDSSNIIIAGGMCRGVPSNDVFIYHTVSKTWKSYLPKMSFKRGENPTVVVADGKVFVFGGGDNLYYTVVMLGKSWAEFYDFSQPSKSWDILPPWSLSISSPSGSPALVPKIISHAVYKNRNQILLWLSPGFVLSFNYRDNSWNRYDKPMSIAAGPQWSSTVVVLENFLFWHNCSTIYAHDLLSDVTIPMYTLPRTGFSSAIFSGDDDDDPKFLVHIGRGMLCLFYQVDNRICYITFLVQISHDVGPPILCLVVGHSGFLKTPSVAFINHALEIS